MKLRINPLKLTLHSFAFALLLLLFGCPGSNNRTEVNSATPEPTKTKKTEFDGDKAFDYLRKQVEFGPRPPASPELEKTRAYIIDQLRSFGVNVTTEEFQATTPEGSKKMANIVAELPGQVGDIIIVGSHYDTKLFKDFKFVGANDAGSSTAVAMEIARVLAMKKLTLKYTYRFVFFDGEEAFCKEWEDCHNPNPADPQKPLPDNTYGSRHYVSQLVQKGEVSRVKSMILLDMIGYKELRLGRADLSTAWLQDIIWQTGRELGYNAQFVNDTEGVGDDDHSPFLKAGIDAVDLIQLSTYGPGSSYWHSKEDTLDKVSAKSLQIVGDTVISSLPKIEERIQSRAR